MKKFNKLYNLILQSIISQNKEFRKNVLAKAGCHQDFIDHSLFRLKNYDNKTGDLLAKFIAKDKDWQWSAPPDPRLDKVAKILKLNPSIDIQKQNGTMDQFIAKYKDLLDKNDAKVAAKTISQLDKIPQFSQKKEYDKGVVIYRVQQSKAGMNAVRKIVEAQWGQKANPWCLITPPMEHAWDFWCQYSEYPKHIAFQNGKLLAFCANEQNQNLWWDRNDQPTITLKLLDGKRIKTKPYKFKDLFDKYNDLRYNRDSGRYDYGKTLKITNEDLVDGHIPIPLGVIKIDFDCSGCTDLIDLTNGPTDVVCNFTLQGCQNLISLRGGPENVGGSVCYQGCRKLESLQGGPKWVGGRYMAYGMDSLKSLKGIPEKVGSTVDCFNNYSLTTLQGAPQEVGADFSCFGCPLTSLIGGPKKVKGKYDCRHTNIKNLQGAPIEVGGVFDCSNNSQLETLDGAPEYVRGLFECDNCPKLKVSKTYGARFRIKSNE